MEVTVPEQKAEDRRGRAAASRSIAHAVAAVALGAALAGLALLLAQHHLHYKPVHADRNGPDQLLGDLGFMGARVASSIALTVAGWYLVTRRPGIVVGRLALAAGLANGISVVASQLALYSVVGGHHVPGVAVLLWLPTWGLAVEPTVLAAVDVLFPDGDWPAGVVGWLGGLAIALCTAGMLHAAVAPLGTDPAGPFAGARNPLGLAILPGLPDWAFILGGSLLASVVVVTRWLKAKGEMRRILRPIGVLSILAWVPFSLVGGIGQTVVGEVLVVLILLVVTAGALRNRVYGIEVVLNRTLVYVALTAVVAAVYGAVVAVVDLLGADVSGRAGLGPAIVAAFSLFPARQRVQRLVNQFLYGQRDEPYAVVSRIGSRLEAAGSPDDLLPNLLDSLVQTLRVPYAAIDLHGDAGVARRIESGSPSVDLDLFPLSHQGRPLGDLVVGRRAGQTALPDGERALLADIARQAAVAASNVLLTEELLSSRERIIYAAEEERRRLRRDLHDGLGPVLTAAASRVDASRNLIRRDTDRAAGLLVDVRADLTAALDDLRRLVYALRPPALDELGLVGAVREHVRRVALPVIVRAPDRFPALPPAVEVTAYRIVAEAVTNVSRHAAATSCTVTLTFGESLVIDVTDDGRATSAWVPGVGLSSMRERTGELGGRWEAGPGPLGGGRVHAELPLRAAAADLAPRGDAAAPVPR